MNIAPRLPSFALALLAAAVLSAPAGRVLAQETRIVNCPADRITSGFTTLEADAWRALEQLGPLARAEIRQHEDGPLLTCIYRNGSDEIAIVRPPPEGSMACRVRAAAAGFVCEPGKSPEIPNDLQGKICQASIQNQIEWDYQGRKRWARNNLERICANADDSLQPGVCFDRIMHGGISHGKGTRWRWPYALKLCAGTRNSQATISCFSSAIEAQIPWPQAIEQCRVKP